MVDGHFELDTGRRDDALETPLQAFMRGAAQVVAVAVITAFVTHLIVSRIPNPHGWDVEAITFATSGLALGIVLCWAIVTHGKRP
jgi:hypothetical protein